MNVCAWKWVVELSCLLLDGWGRDEGLAEAENGLLADGWGCACACPSPQLSQQQSTFSSNSSSILHFHHFLHFLHFLHHFFSHLNPNPHFCLLHSPFAVGGVLCPFPHFTCCSFSQFSSLPHLNLPITFYLFFFLF